MIKITEFPEFKKETLKDFLDKNNEYEYIKC